MSLQISLKTPGEGSSCYCRYHLKTIDKATNRLDNTLSPDAEITNSATPYHVLPTLAHVRYAQASPMTAMKDCYPKGRAPRMITRVHVESWMEVFAEGIDEIWLTQDWLYHCAESTGIPAMVSKIFLNHAYHA